MLPMTFQLWKLDYEVDLFHAKTNAVFRFEDYIVEGLHLLLRIYRQYIWGGQNMTYTQVNTAAPRYWVFFQIHDSSIYPFFILFESEVGTIYSCDRPNICELAIYPTLNYTRHERAGAMRVGIR